MATATILSEAAAGTTAKGDQHGGCDPRADRVRDVQGFERAHRYHSRS